MIAHEGGSPIISITFLSGDGSHIVRQWYHVPRVGDSVYLVESPTRLEASAGLGPVTIVGRVRQVKWDGDGRSAEVYVG